MCKSRTAVDEVATEKTRHRRAGPVLLGRQRVIPQFSARQQSLIRSATTQRRKDTERFQVKFAHKSRVNQLRRNR
jgi:hypothetical protein